MLYIKDFRTTTKSYILTLQDSETNELSEKVYDFDNFDGQAWSAAYEMLMNIKNGEYKLSMDINVNRKTAALLDILTQLRRDRHVIINFNMYNSYSDSDLSKKYYGYYLDKDGKRTYIADYKVDRLGNIKLVKVEETADVKDENYDIILKKHKNLIRKTGEFNGVKFHKFNRVEFLALMLIARKRIDVFKL